MVYHYTSIKTLGLILKNRKIRFTRFDLLDDQTETEGLPELLQKRYFLSCWVHEERENIHQWAMYASEGVRIEFPEKWYKKHPIPIAGTNKVMYSFPVPDDQFLKNMFLILPFKEYFNVEKGYTFVPPLDEQDGLLTKVIYSEDYVKLKESYWSNSEDDNEIKMIHQAAPIKFKDSYWSFQNEIRYYIQAVVKYEDVFKLPQFLDVEISDEALKNIKVKLYPNCSEENKILVESLLKNFLPNVDVFLSIERSRLDGKYRPKNT